MTRIIISPASLRKVFYAEAKGLILLERNIVREVSLVKEKYYAPTYSSKIIAWAKKAL